MKKMLRTAAALLLSGCMMTAPALAATSFSDVPNDQGINYYVVQAAKEGLVAGIGGGKFGVGQKVTNAEFATMVCKLFYNTEANAYHNTYKNTYSASEWWRPFLAVAYTKGLLNNTEMGVSRAANNSWAKSVVEQPISRYDMAQVMMNVADVQGWADPSAQEILDAQAKIGDWKNIPAKYQAAVAAAYAKGFLSGMQDGTFSGGNSMLREQSAVVLCRMSDAKNKSAETDSPTFTNTTKLVNGKAPTEDNVESAVEALKKEYPTGYVWNVSKSYVSPKLGTGTGGNGFIYMLSDQVFGNLELEAVEPEELKAGDVIYVSNGNGYILVEEVSEDEFTYVTCNSSGRVTWGNEADIDDIGSLDQVYTRYEAEDEEDTLSNGKAATQSNVKKLLEEFFDEEYDEGDTWDESYKSSQFSSKTVTGSRAFAYYLSDYVFGELEVEDVDDFDDLRVGDVIYWDDYEEYIVVTGIDGDTIDYVGVDEDDEVYADDLDVDDLDEDDFAQTRYPQDADEEDDTLSNGKSATASNVEDLIEEFFDEEYDEGDTWDKSYKSGQFTSKTVSGSRAFAYYLSDYIFGELEVEDVDDFDDLRVGDVIYWDDYEEYIVVTGIDGDDISYVGVEAKKVYADELDVDDLDEDDFAQTRYPQDAEDTLSNGKSVTDSNVEDLMETFFDDEYGDGEEWNYSYKSDNFGGERAYRDEAYAYYLSDYIFGDLDVEGVDDFDDLRVGDVLYLDGSEEYVVVTAVDGDDISYVGVANKEVYTDELDVDELDKDDFAYTRYPQDAEEEDDTLSNGKSATTSNVKALMKKFFEEKYNMGADWDQSYKSTYFKKDTVTEHEAFAYYLSDYVFGKLSVKKVTDFDDLRVGDVIYWAGTGEYMVVTDIDGDDVNYVTVYGGKVYTDELDADELDSKDKVYTRYP